MYTCYIIYGLQVNIRNAVITLKINDVLDNDMENHKLKKIEFNLPFNLKSKA